MLKKVRTNEYIISQMITDEDFSQLEIAGEEGSYLIIGDAKTYVVNPSLLIGENGKEIISIKLGRGINEEELKEAIEDVIVSGVDENHFKEMARDVLKEFYKKSDFKQISFLKAVIKIGELKQGEWIEIGKDEEQNIWISIYGDNGILGNSLAEHYRKHAIGSCGIEIEEREDDMCYLEGFLADRFVGDMIAITEYHHFSRLSLIRGILDRIKYPEITGCYVSEGNRFGYSGEDEMISLTLNCSVTGEEESSMVLREEDGIAFIKAEVVDDEYILTEDGFERQFSLNEIKEMFEVVRVLKPIYNFKG